MGALTGTWYIYSQKIGADAVFKSPDSQVTFDADNKTAGFDLATKEEVLFTISGTSKYYLGASSLYRYRAQLIEDSGAKLLIGHVSTAERNEKRCLFAGLPATRGATRNPDTLDLLRIFHIPFFYTVTSEPTAGKLHIDRKAIPQPTVQLKKDGEADLDFLISEDSQNGSGIHLKAKRASPYDDELEARIIFTPGSRPVCIGYHWRPSTYFSLKANDLSVADRVPTDGTIAHGAPTDERCTRGIVGW